MQPGIRAETLTIVTASRRLVSTIVIGQLPERTPRQQRRYPQKTPGLSSHRAANPGWIPPRGRATSHVTGSPLGAPPRKVKTPLARKLLGTPRAPQSVACAGHVTSPSHSLTTARRRLRRLYGGTSESDVPAAWRGRQPAVTAASAAEVIQSTRPLGTNCGPAPARLSARENVETAVHCAR